MILQNRFAILITLLIISSLLFSCSRNIVTVQGKCSKSKSISLSYIYKDNTLFLTHNGLNFNCCLDKIEATYKIDGNKIIITEKEVYSNPCRCICSYSVNMKIPNVPAKKYTIETLNIKMEADLVNATTGQESKNRTPRRIIRF